MTGDYDSRFQRPEGGWAQRLSDPRASAPAEPLRSTEDGEYRAYGVTPTDDLDTCDIAWWLGNDTPQGQEVRYHYIVRIGWVGDEQINLMLTDAIITIEGQWLRDLRKRLSRRKVTFIQAYHSKHWPKPALGQPLVERIGILYPGEKAL